MSVFYARNNIFGPYCSVYLDNLSKEVTEATLFKTFNQVGVISSARVVRDPNTGLSLGRAYLNFVDPVDAEKALKLMNGKNIAGKPVRIRRKKRETNLFVKNIPEECTKDDLEERFSKFGKIASCRIMETSSGQNMGYGYIRFQDQDGADKAIDASITGKIKMRGKQIEAGYYQTWKERNHEMNMNEHFFTCIHLKGYPKNYKEADIKGLFEEGKDKPPVTIEIAKKADGSPKLFSFLTFEKHEDAQAAINKLNEKKLDDEHVLSATRLMSNFERQQAMRKKYQELKRCNHQTYKGRNLYVKNFPLDWDKDQLQDLFSKYGTVTSTKVMKNNKDASKGFGFVCFEDKTMAQRALKSLNDFLIEGKPLCVNMAELKEQRQARLWQAGPMWRSALDGAVVDPAYGYQPRGRPRGWRSRGRGRGRGRGGYRPKPTYYSSGYPSEWMPIQGLHMPVQLA